MSTLLAGSGIPLLALPVESVLRRVLVEAFPPNGVVLKVMNNVGKYCIFSCRSKRVGVGLCVCSGSYAKEARFSCT
jgi:hypothetical protein